jgi:hypothetical protein
MNMTPDTFVPSADSQPLLQQPAAATSLSGVGTSGLLQRAAPPKTASAHAGSNFATVPMTLPGQLSEDPPDGSVLGWTTARIKFRPTV